jgi:hypothetical protein
MHGQSVGTFIDTVNKSIFGPQPNWPAPFQDYRRSGNQLVLTRTALCMRVTGIVFGSEVLERNVVISSLSSDTYIQLEIGLGVKTLTQHHREMIRQNTSALQNSLMHSQRASVTDVDHERHPKSVEEKNPNCHSKNSNEDTSPYQTLADMVDAGNLQGTLKSLDSLGRFPPRLSNVVVAAFMSSDTASRQYVGTETETKWMNGTANTAGERRLYSILDLAWRRRYHFVSHAILVYEQYSKTGILHYLWDERELWNGAFNKVMVEVVPKTITELILEYVNTNVFPHGLDQEGLVVDGEDAAFTNSDSAPLIPPVVLTEEAVGVISVVPGYRKLFGGSEIDYDSNGVGDFDPYPRWVYRHNERQLQLE